MVSFFFLLFFFFFSTVFISLVRFLSFCLAPYHCAHAFFIIHWLLNRTFPLFRFVNSCTLFSYWSECPVLCQTPFLSELNATHLPLHTPYSGIFRSVRQAAATIAFIVRADQAKSIKLDPFLKLWMRWTWYFLTHLFDVSCMANKINW